MTNENEKQSNHEMLKGAFVLSIAALVAKVLSALYKVPFQNLTGDEGFYVYQQVYPFYGIAVAFALNGLPLFISKVVAEYKDEGSKQAISIEIGKKLSFFSIALFAMLWFGSDWIAVQMGDIQLSPVIQAISYVYLLIPFLSVIRGYFQGNLNMYPTSISQVGEQLVRVAILLGVAFTFTQKSWSVYEMGTYAIHSAWISSLFGILILGLFLRKEQRVKMDKATQKLPTTRILFEGFAITAMGSIMVLFQFIDSFTVYNGLLDQGFTEQLAMSMKGIYDRGQPFVQLGLVTALGFSTSLLPLLRRYIQDGKEEKWKKTASSVFKMTLIFSGAAMTGLIAVMPWMNQALFSDQEGTLILQVFVISVLLASLISCLHSIVQSIEASYLPIISLAIGLTFKLLFNRFAVRTVGLMGSSYVTIFSLVIICLILMLPILQELSPLGYKFYLKLIVGLISMGLLVNRSIYYIMNLFSLDGRTWALLFTLFGVILGGAYFIYYMLKAKLLTETEIDTLPFSKKMKKVV